jgi:hypothetical protein
MAAGKVREREREREREIKRDQIKIQSPRELSQRCTWFKQDPPPKFPLVSNSQSNYEPISG